MDAVSINKTSKFPGTSMNHGWKEALLSDVVAALFCSSLCFYFVLYGSFKSCTTLSNKLPWPQGCHYLQAQVLQAVSLGSVYMEIEHWSVSSVEMSVWSGIDIAVQTLSFIFQHPTPRWWQPSAKCCNSQLILFSFLLVARHKSKCLSRPGCSLDCVFVCVLRNLMGLWGFCLDWDK